MKTNSNRWSLSTTILTLLSLAIVIPPLPICKAASFSVQPTVSTTVPWRNPPRPAPPVQRHALPFTLIELVTLLNQEMGAESVQTSTDYALLYLNRNSDRAEDLIQIVVRSTPQGLSVQFTFQNATAMHFVGEFLESQLFTSKESEKLYGLLNSPGHEHRWEAMGRFHARVTTIPLADRTEIRLEFTSDPSRV